MLSVVVLTKNEEKNIEECLKSLEWADEIVIVDDCSEDRTVGKIREMGERREIGEKIKIFERKLDGDFAEQRNFALQQVQGDWILFLDADERVSPALRKEIESVTSYKYPLVKGFYLKRLDVMWGKTLKHGEAGRVRLLRLGRKGEGEWEGKVHEIWKIGPSTPSTALRTSSLRVKDLGELGEPLVHLPHPTMTEFLEDINTYSTLRAKELYDQGRKTNLLEILSFPAIKFFQNWIFRLGFMDGMPGFAVAILMSFHSFLVRSKLYLLWKRGGEWN